MKINGYSNPAIYRDAFTLWAWHFDFKPSFNCVTECHPTGSSHRRCNFLTGLAIK